MEILVSTLLAILSGVLLLPITVFSAEIAAAAFLPGKKDVLHKGDVSRNKIAVLVPAHNESTNILPTIADIKRQLLPSDWLLVVADNCSDDTAAIALAAGADVIERHSLDKRGKGYALEFGVKHLAADPPEVLIIIDADCRLTDNTIELLSKTCGLTQRPIQALNLMITPEKSRNTHGRVSEFAWRVKNWVRPLGLHLLNLPCQLMGTGMAFPWKAIRVVDLGTAMLAEDLMLGLDLARLGYSPLFCPSACVTSQFASTTTGIRSQRERWEHGHISAIFACVPQLLCSAVVRRNFSLLALALDLAVPPLALLVTVSFGMLAITSLAAFVGYSSAALIINALNIFALLGSISVAWLKYGRQVLPSNGLLTIAPYIFLKLSFYIRVLVRKQRSQWIRTDRSKSE